MGSPKQVKAWRDRNPVARAKHVEQQRAKRHAWRVTDPEAYRTYYRDQSRRITLRSKYGMTVEQYEELFKSQGCRCAICRTTEPGAKKTWRVDHCHSTNKVRGILCHHCNVSLGLIKDSIETLQAMINYLTPTEKI